MKEVRLSSGDLVFPALTDGEGETVVLLHGFPDCHRNWEGQIRALAGAGFRAVAPALRGYAPACIPDNGDYSLLEAVDDLLAQIDQLDGPVHLVGHDWGAAVSYLAAASAPERFRSLTTLAIPPLKRLPSALLKVPEQLLYSAYMEFFQLPRLPEWWLSRNDFSGVAALWNRWSPEWEAGDYLDRACDTLAQPGVLSAALGWYRFLPRFWTPASRQVREWMGWRIEVPTLILQGRRDGCMTERLLHHTIFDSDFPAGLEVETVAGAGHFLHLERPERVNDLLVRHLKAHSGG